MDLNVTRTLDIKESKVVRYGLGATTQDGLTLRFTRDMADYMDLVVTQFKQCILSMEVLFARFDYNSNTIYVSSNKEDWVAITGNNYSVIDHVMKQKVLGKEFIFRETAANTAPISILNSDAYSQEAVPNGVKFSSRNGFNFVLTVEHSVPVVSMTKNKNDIPLVDVSRIEYSSSLQYIKFLSSGLHLKITNLPEAFTQIMNAEAKPDYVLNTEVTDYPVVQNIDWKRARWDTGPVQVFTEDELFDISVTRDYRFPADMFIYENKISIRILHEDPGQIEIPLGRVDYIDNVRVYNNTVELSSDMHTTRINHSTSFQCSYVDATGKDAALFVIDLESTSVSFFITDAATAANISEKLLVWGVRCGRNFASKKMESVTQHLRAHRLKTFSAL